MRKLKICLIIVTLFLPVLICASEQTIAINEICWMGGNNSANDEWVELFNNSEQEINLDGWVLKTADDGIKINLKGKIPSGGFFLLERTDDNSAPSAKADLIYQGALSNEGEDLKLIDSNNNFIDEVNCAKNWFTGDNKTKQTMEQINPNASSSDKTNWQTSQSPGGTPSQPNSQNSTDPVKEPTSTVQTSTVQEYVIEQPNQSDANRSDRYSLHQAGSVFISEVMPSPEGSDAENEWIELYNANDFEADISSWKIRDRIGAVKTYTLPQNSKIEANSFLVLKRLQTKISLNNEGDGLELLNPSEQIIDNVDYEKAKQGQSWSKTENGFLWTAKPTPGAANIIVKTATQATTKTLPASPQNEKLLAQVNSPSITSGQGAALKNKNILAVIIAAFIAAGSAVIAWQIKKKSIEI